MPPTTSKDAFNSRLAKVDNGMFLLMVIICPFFLLILSLYDWILGNRLTALALIIVAGFVYWMFRYTIEVNKKDRSDRIEKLATVEHEQWRAWSESVAPEVSDERRERWKKLWIPYSELSDDDKEKDREYARTVFLIMDEP